MWIVQGSKVLGGGLVVSDMGFMLDLFYPYLRRLSHFIQHFEPKMTAPCVFPGIRLRTRVLSSARGS